MKYSITVSRRCYRTYSVEADNVDIATDEAVEQAYQDDWADEDSEYKVIDTCEEKENE